MPLDTHVAPQFLCPEGSFARIEGSESNIGPPHARFRSQKRANVPLALEFVPLVALLEGVAAQLEGGGTDSEGKPRQKGSPR